MQTSRLLIVIVIIVAAAVPTHIRIYVYTPTPVSSICYEVALDAQLCHVLCPSRPYVNYLNIERLRRTIYSFFFTVLIIIVRLVHVLFRFLLSYLEQIVFIIIGTDL